MQVHWIFKNKDHGKMSATASLGTVLLWDVEGGLPQVRFSGLDGMCWLAGAAWRGLRALSSAILCTLVCMPRLVPHLLYLPLPYTLATLPPSHCPLPAPLPPACPAD
jgi:hypothetical protein